jgi:hypothetical protein
MESKSEYDKSSFTFLADQGIVLPKNQSKDRDNQEWQILRGHAEAKLISLRNWRQSWWTQNWSDLAEFILPRRSIWLTQSTGGNPNPNSMTRGRPINTAIADPTATYAVRICASGLMSGLASPSRPWFKVIPSHSKFEIDADARVWLDSIEDKIYTVIAGSNFYNAFAQECEDLVVFGTGPSIVYEDELDLIRLYNPAVGEYYLSTDANNRINGLYRLFVMTVEQIVGFFGIDQCTKEIQDLWTQKGSALQMEKMIAHAIEPNYGVGPKGEDGKIKGNFTWREIYWVYGQGSVSPLSIRGFRDQPFTAARWSIQSNDAYGRSPGMDVLPDVMQLQVMTRRKAEAIEKMVRPPLIGSMELKNKPTSTLPGHLTFVSNMGPGQGIRPIYEVNPDISHMVVDIQNIEKRIQMGFFNDLFLMLEQKLDERMTAYEVAQKLQEKLQVLGPVIESLLAESLKPKLKRIFNILKRKGMIEPPPDSLKGVPLDIEFVSMLALAQKGAATGGIERLMSMVGSMAAVYPTALDNINSDAVVREYNDLLGNPQKVLNGPEQVQQLREMRQKQQEQMQQQQQMAQMAESMGKAAPAAAVLQDTQVGGGQSALGKLLGG